MAKTLPLTIGLLSKSSYPLILGTYAEISGGGLSARRPNSDSHNFCTDPAIRDFRIMDIKKLFELRL